MRFQENGALEISSQAVDTTGFPGERYRASNADCENTWIPLIYRNIIPIQLIQFFPLPRLLYVHICIGTYTINTWVGTLHKL